MPPPTPLLARLPGLPLWVVGDRDYSSRALRAYVWNLSARPAIPSKWNRAPVACPSWVGHNCNRVERPQVRLKEWRIEL